MEDIISTILDVVRAQHTATEGTDQKPFDMDDIVDMAMNVVGRPDEPEDIQSMTDSIQKMVVSMAPDLFPPKTFEQMDDEERVASVTSMLESRLINGFTPRKKPVVEEPEKKEPAQTVAQTTSAAQAASAAQSAQASAQSAQAASAARSTQTAAQAASAARSTQTAAQAASATRPTQSAAQVASAAQSAQTSGQSGSQEASDPFASMDLALERAQYDSIMESLKEQGVTGDLDPRQTAELNDIIYKNLMDLMGATPPKVEYPFDRSQIRYGKEKTFTEQLEEEREAQLQAQAGPQIPTGAQSQSNAQPQTSSQSMASDQTYTASQSMAGSQPQTASQSMASDQTYTASQSSESDQVQSDSQSQVFAQSPAGGFSRQAPPWVQTNTRAQAHAQGSSGGHAPKVSAADLAQSLIDQDDGPQVSAWDIAQNAVNIDEELHKKEPYKPKPVEEPKTKSASQLAAEAIARAQEEDRMKLEIEKQAEALMAEAKKRGQDPMKFALHQQEILQYMEKNTDELVSFEDYEDLSPEEKLEVERQIYIEKQIANGVDPDKVDTEVPEEYIPLELKAKPAPVVTGTPVVPGTPAGANPAPVMSEEMLRMISREVVQENSEMILAENANEDLDQLQQTIFENLKNMMDKTGEPLPLEDVGDLIEQAIAANRESQIGGAAAAVENPAASQATADNNETNSIDEAPAETKLSAVELAKAAQKEAKVEPKEERVTRSAADIAKEAQMKALAAKLDPASAAKASDGAGAGASANTAAGSGAGASADTAAGSGAGASADIEGGSGAGTTSSETGIAPSDAGSKTDNASETGAKPKVAESQAAESQTEDAGGKADAIPVEEDDDDEYEYVDPDELVLGEHTQAEVDEALANLATLGLEGDVYERAKRMLLLELASSEAELEAWLKDQENKKSKKSSVADDTIEDINDLDEDELERELEEALDGDFLEEDFLDDIEFEEDESEDESDATEDESGAEEAVYEDETGAEAETGSEDKSGSEAEAGSEDKSGSEAETGSEDKSEAKAEAGSGSETDAESEDESDVEVETGSEEESDSESEDESEDDFEDESDSATEDDSDDSGAEEESDAAAEAESEKALSEEESDAESDSESEDEFEEESDTGTESASDADSDAGIEADSESEKEKTASDEETFSEEDSDASDEFEYNEETEEPVIEVSPEDDNIIDVKHLDEESEIIEVIKDTDEAEAEEAEAPKPADSPAQSGGGTSYGGKGSHRKKVYRRRERSGTKEDKDGKDRFAKGAGDKPAEEKSYQVSTRKPFILKNSASFMDQFEDFIVDTQENRKLSTGFKKLDGMLRYGLHKGSYFIDSQPQYLKNAFMQQIADRAAESGIDVLYISTELSRYDLMVETISRLSYEIHQGDPGSAVSAMAIMTGEEGADLASLKDELNWYRGRISEHLFILDHEAISEYAASSDAATAGDVLTELISSIVREGAHKPVVFIDNIENILSTEDSEDMKPLMEGLSRLAKELGIPILMSYGYAQAESEEEMYPEEREYHESIGNMCDVYLELEYADMIADDMIPLTADDIREMVDEGESLLINILLHKNRRPMKASLQIQGTPKFNFFEE